MREHQKERLPQGHYTKELRRLNGYTEGELCEWLFEPGMNYADTEKWWQLGATRTRPHEGLDLLYFMDKTGKKHMLPGGTATPPVFGGFEVARIPDFLGETLILAHDFLDEAGRRLHTFYAHLQPTAIAAKGKKISSHSEIGTIAAPSVLSPACPPHLHISVAWVGEEYPIKDFRWGNYCAGDFFCPLDPIELICRK